MTRVLVTGALGNVGSAVADSLLDRGAPVTVADRDVGSLRERFPSATAVHLDFLDDRTFQSALSDVDSLFLIRPPAISRVGPTLNELIAEAERADVSHIVFSSVAGADSNRLVPHHRVEQRLFDSSVAWTIIRPGFFTQNIGTAYRQDIVEHGRLFVPAGDGRVAFIDARDIGEVAALSLTDRAHRSRTYHLTGPEAVTFYEVADMLTDVIGREIRYEPAGALAYFRHLRAQHLALTHALVQTILHVGLRRGDAEPVTHTVEQVLGRKPRTVRSYIEEQFD